jgi:hypothetical protein
MRFDFASPAALAARLSAPAAVAAAESAQETEREYLQRVCVAGLKMCVGLLVLLWVCLNADLLLALYRQAALAWPKLFPY